MRVFFASASSISFLFTSRHCSKLLLAGALLGASACGGSDSGKGRSGGSAKAAAADSAAVSLTPPAGEIGKVIGRPVGSDPRFAQLLDTSARLTTIAAGFKWTEGPLWVPNEKALLFSHAPTNEVYKWSPTTGTQLYLKHSGYVGDGAYGREPGSNGLALDAQGQLVLCQHGNRRVAVLAADGEQQSLANRFQGKRLNSPNDLVFRHATGDLYFTDPPFGLPKQELDLSKEIRFQGVYMRRPGGQLLLVTKELSRPNGIAFSPDEKTLYVTNSDSAKAVLLAFPVLPNGMVGTARTVRDFSSLVRKLPGLPDGVKVDKAGNLYVCGPGGLYVLTPDGKQLGLISTAPNIVSNCAWGDADGSTLYVTAGAYVARIPTKTHGAGLESK